MSTATLSSLLDYLYGTLTPSNMRWVGEHLIEYAKKEEEPSALDRYTKAELNSMLDKAEADFKAGLGITSEEVWREVDNEFALHCRFLGHPSRT